MKFSTILMALGFATAAIAASTTETSTSAAPSVSLSPTQLCLNSCALGDVTCQAECMGVPSPDAAAVNATTECAGKCEQGDGSAAATQKYSDCVQACIKSDFYTTTRTGAPESTSAANSNSNSDSNGSGTQSAAGTNSGNSQPTGTGTRASGSATGTHSGSSPTASAGTNAAPVLVTGGSFVGLFAIVAGILVL